MRDTTGRSSLPTDHDVNMCRTTESVVLRLIAVWLTCVAAGCADSTVDQLLPAATPPPNIVFILIDDLGWADLPVQGHAFHETPNIDRLAREGIRFTSAYAAAPVCSPTRASIQAGQYPARLGITDFIPGHWRPFEQLIVPRNRTQHLPLDVITFAEALAEQGYATGYFGKWHLENIDGDAFLPAEQGYDAAVIHRGWGHVELRDQLFPDQGPGVEPRYLANVLTDLGVGFIQENQGRPFLLMLSHFAVHIPLEAQPALIDKYEIKPRPEQGVNNVIYAAMVEQVDRSVGRILDALSDLGLSENTVVVFFSDNGGLSERFDRADDMVVTSNAPLRDEKGSLYEGGIRVPLIIRWPGVAAPGISDAVVSSVDVYPTFLDIARVQRPSNQLLDGISLVPLLRGEPPDADRTAYFHYPHYHHSVPASALRRGPFKLLEFYDAGRTELYNLTDDIGEQNNLAEEMPETTSELRALLAAWLASVGAEMPRRNPDFDPARRGEWGQHPDGSPPLGGDP